MHKFYVITFSKTGKTAIMRQTVIGGHEVALMSREGLFVPQQAITEPFECQEIGFLLP